MANLCVCAVLFTNLQKIFKELGKVHTTLRHVSFTVLSNTILKALLPVCMEYTASSGKYSMWQNRVLYLSRDSHQVMCISYKRSDSVLSILLYFIT